MDRQLAAIKCSASTRGPGLYWSGIRKVLISLSYLESVLPVVDIRRDGECYWRSKVFFILSKLASLLTSTLLRQSTSSYRLLAQTQPNPATILKQLK